MENNNFDRRIREKLQGLEENYQAGDWERMEQKLDAEFNASPEMEDVLLDGMAYGSLKDLEVGYNETHWDLMEQKLDGTYAIRRKIYRYKIVEVALVFLAIFTILQFLPFNKQKTASQEIANSSNPSDINTDEFNFDILNDKNANEVKPEDADLRNEASQNLTDINSSGNPEQEDIVENVTPSGLQREKTERQINNSEQKVGSGINITQTLFEDRVAAVVNKEKEQVSFLDEPDSRLSLASRFSVAGTKSKLDFASLSPIALFPPGEVNVLNQSALPECILCKPFKSPIHVSIGMSVGPDADYVTTPYDSKYQQEAFSQIALGYSGGFTLGFKYNKWELETGAVYASTSYGSRNNLELSGSFAQGGYVQQGLAGAQLDIVRVPLNLRYNFMDKKKWNYYVVTGGSVNMTVETLYEYTTETVGRFNAMASRSADTQDASPYDGILEGGGFLDNTFLTANLGLGVERYFTSRMSIFFQPTYSHQLSRGLGPQKDKINSLQIMTGARVTLKRKKSKR